MHIRQEMLHRAQQEKAKAPALRIYLPQPRSQEQPGEELLRQVAGHFLTRSRPAYQNEHRRVIRGAQVAQGLSRLRRIPPRRQHLRPLRRDEDAGGFGTRWSCPAGSRISLVRSMCLHRLARRQ